MCMCVCVCMYVCVYVCVCVREYVCVYGCARASVSVCVIKFMTQIADVTTYDYSLCFWQMAPESGAHRYIVG